MIPILIFIILLAIIIFMPQTEFFTVPPVSSVYSFTDYNGYGDGYGDGYGLYGYIIDPLTGIKTEKEPWLSILRRMPKYISTPYTPAPQIDYNTTPSPVEGPLVNYYVNIVNNTLSINGVPNFTAQMDKNRLYYFSVYTPGMPFCFSLDGINPFPIDGITGPVESGTFQVVFDKSLPNKIYYISPGYEEIGGIIYLNNI